MLIGKLPSFQVHWGRYVSMVTGDSEISSDSLEHYDLGMGTRRAKKTVSITDEELLKISSANTNMRFEIVDGELIAMTPLELFIPDAPDFLIEIRSGTDSFPLIKTRLREWIESGCRLAFLIDLFKRKAYAYRRDGSVTEYPYSATPGGEEVLPGFSVCPAEIEPE